jgi:hypothetical protein
MDARQVRLAFLAVTFLAAMTGCANHEQMMAASGETPAAEGKVSTGKGDNDNTAVRVEVKHLAPPSRVAPGAMIYVVWVQPLGQSIQNVGALKLNDDLVGRLDFVTPHKTFRVVVTPETQATLETPSHHAVFTADVNER